MVWKTQVLDPDNHRSLLTVLKKLLFFEDSEIGVSPFFLDNHALNFFESFI